MKFVAVDQGTTSTRALVLECDGTTRIARSIKHSQFFPRSGWVEHDAEELLLNVIACFEAAGPADALGLSNQGESCLAWDSNTGRALSPVIVWQDNRTVQEVELLRSRGLEKQVRELAGLPLDPYFSASKLRWLIDNVAEVAQALKEGRLRLGTTDAFFLQRLTGICATDATTASRTSLMNLRTGQWDEELCRIFGVPISCLPEIKPSSGSFGETAYGPLTAAATDQQAALYGHGCRKAGDLKITFGTGAFCLAVTNEVPEGEKLSDGLLPTVAWRFEDRVTYALDGGVYDVGSSIEWAVKNGIAASVNDFQSFESGPAIDRGVAFVPAFSGLACPFWDRTAAPVLIGLTHSSNLADVRQALLEGIVFLTCAVVDAMSEMVQVGKSISIDGGLSRSPHFCQFLADVTGKTIEVSEMDEITAYGMASMAAMAIGAEPRGSHVGDAKTYSPRPVARDVWKSKFRQAVDLARGWNS